MSPKDETLTMDEWDGQTINNRPYISADSDRIVKCVVKTSSRHDGDGYANNCGWEGPVHETERGKAMMGSKPRRLCCPKCGRHLASEKGTTGAGYWGDVLNG